jgi:hypothetical protein
MKAFNALLIASSVGLTAPAQSPHPTPSNWGPTKDGVRIALSLDKQTYTVGEDVPLHIATQIVSATRPVYGEPDRPSGAFFARWDFSRAFHLTITDEDGRVVGNKDPSNLIFVISGSSGPIVCPAPLDVGRIYTLDFSANGKQSLLPTQPGTYRITVLWSPYTVSDPPCTNSEGASDSEEFRPFVTVSSIPITIHITGRP